MSKPIVVSLGELLWDMLPTGKRAGGAPMNFAYHAMNNGCEAYAVSAVGEDELGDELAIAAEKAGIHAVLQRNAWPTGTVEVALKNGIPEYTIVENVMPGSHLLHPPAHRHRRAGRRRVLRHAGTALPESHDTIIELLKHTKDGALKFFDINLRGDMYSKELIEEMLSYANVFKINDEELLLMRGMFGIENTSDEEACKWFIEQFDLRYLILTGGATFSTIMSNDGEVSTLATPHVTVADTVGAGDSFSGTFTGRILNGDSLGLAHRAAVNTAAFVCTQEGAWPTYPAEITDYLAEIGK